MNPRFSPKKSKSEASSFFVCVETSHYSEDHSGGATFLFRVMGAVGLSNPLGLGWSRQLRKNEEPRRVSIVDVGGCI